MRKKNKKQKKDEELEDTEDEKRASGEEFPLNLNERLSPKTSVSFKEPF